VFRWIILLIIVAGLLCVVYGVVIERRWYRVRRYRLDILPAAGGTQLRVLHLSDLHLVRRDRRMPAFLALPSFLLPPEQSGQGYGLYQLFYSFGFFAQPLVGLLVDRSGTYATGFYLVAGYTVLGAVCALPVVRRMGLNLQLTANS